MGYIVVIEGTDGSGKATQSEELKNRLELDGFNVIRQSFPNYESPSSAPIKMYLGGVFGDNPFPIYVVTDHQLLRLLVITVFAGVVDKTAFLAGGLFIPVNNPRMRTVYSDGKACGKVFPRKGDCLLAQFVFVIAAYGYTVRPIRLIIVGGFGEL
jgi:hypothetical protein